MVCGSRLLSIFCLLAFIDAAPSWASKTTYTNANPVGWMHMLPTGETPGWTENAWLNLELSQSNIWNKKLDATNLTTGQTVSYEADFEQGSIVLDTGFALGSHFSFGIEAPFASRGGGILDQFIDQFHMFIGSDRFSRNYNPFFSDNFGVQTNGQDQIYQTNLTAVGNMKVKLKYWALQWRGSKNGSCDCGLAFSGQAKFPLAQSRSGMTSGHNDYSFLVHLGAPLFKDSGIWATAAFTTLGRNEIFADWPQRRYAQMYELAMDLAFTDHWGLLLSARTESPIMNKGELAFQYSSSNSLAQAAERGATGWNSLVYWRSSQGFGFRWRASAGHELSLLLVEDWGLGSQDQRGDDFYVNNAPDIEFVTKLHLSF